jgi:hypothetical protein
MGMFDTIYAELDCPFCGRQYCHAPLTHEQAEKEVKEYKQRQIQSRQDYLRGERKFCFQDFWAKRDGFDDTDAWVEHLDSPDEIQAHRMQLSRGLAEIQTKQFENVLDHFFVGDKIPQYVGHSFIREDFKCEGCSSADESVYVNVWFEIEGRKLKAVLTRNPETGKPEREVHKHTPVEPRLPDPHPRVHFEYRNLQSHAKWNDETSKYDMKVHHLPEHYTFSYENEELLRIMFESFADDYLYWSELGTTTNPLYTNIYIPSAATCPQTLNRMASANVMAQIALVTASIF